MSGGMYQFHLPLFYFLLIVHYCREVLLLCRCWKFLFQLEHFVKSAQIQIFFWSVFLSPCIQSECGKIRTRKNSVFRHFSRSGMLSSLDLNIYTCLWIKYSANHFLHLMSSSVQRRLPNSLHFFQFGVVSCAW